jgi:hypothetical protein
MDRIRIVYKVQGDAAPHLDILVRVSPSICRSNGAKIMKNGPEIVGNVHIKY